MEWGAEQRHWAAEAWTERTDGRAKDEREDGHRRRGTAGDECERRASVCWGAAAATCGLRNRGIMKEKDVRMKMKMKMKMHGHLRSGECYLDACNESRHGIYCGGRR